MEDFKKAFYDAFKPTQEELDAQAAAITEEVILYGTAITLLQNGPSGLEMKHIPRQEWDAFADDLKNAPPVYELKKETDGNS
jgi:hypothetical protein